MAPEASDCKHNGFVFFLIFALFFQINSHTVDLNPSTHFDYFWWFLRCILKMKNPHKRSVYKGFYGSPCPFRTPHEKRQKRKETAKFIYYLDYITT